MGDGFKISNGITLPTECVCWVISFLAKRNAGKTYGAAVFVEELLKNKFPTIIIDSMGIWWGLRVGADKDGNIDSKKPGLPVVVFGGKHADIQLDPAKIRKMAEAIMQTGISAVLDVSQFRKGQQLQIVTEFAEEIYVLADKYPAERMLVVEEVDGWAPQKPGKEQLRCLGAFEDLVRRGGNRNLGFTGITQRSAVYNKDLLTQSDCIVVLRTTAPQDKKAIQEWVEKQAEEDPQPMRKWLDSLAELKNGEAYVWHPDPPKIDKIKIKFRRRDTFHATRKFILSKEAATVRLMPVNEFITRYKDRFELTPKPLGERTIETLREDPAPVRADTVLKPSAPNGNPIAELQFRKPVAGIETRKPTLAANDREVIGQILYAITQGAFDERQPLSKAVEALNTFGWPHDRNEVNAALTQLCDLKFFTRKISTGNMMWYALTPDAKARIVLLEVNAT